MQQQKTDSSFYVLWHIMLVGALSYSLVYTTLDLVYHFEVTWLTAMMDVFLSGLFIADMCISAKYFFPKYFNPETGEKPYRQTKWFWIDLVGVIPFDLFIYLSLQAISDHSMAAISTSIFSILRLSRLVRLAKGIRLVQEIRKSVFFLHLPVPVKLAMALGPLLFFAHVLSCGWMMFNPIAKNEQLLDHYVKSFYFITTTLTTIGYGDITPQTTFARLYTMCLQLMGVAIFGVVIGHISKLFLAQSKHEEAQREKMQDLALLLGHYSVPAKIQKQVFAYHRHLAEKHLTDNDAGLINDLPDALQEEIRVFMKLKLLHGIPLFDNLEAPCLKEVANSLKKKHFNPHGLIIKKGDIGTELFVIGHGSVNVLGPENKIIVTLKKGQFFGERALLEDTARSADVEAAEYSDMYTFQKEDFLRIIKNYPQLYDRIYATVNRRYGDSMGKDSMRPNPPPPKNVA